MVRQVLRPATNDNPVPLPRRLRTLLRLALMLGATAALGWSIIFL